MNNNKAERLRILREILAKKRIKMIPNLTSQKPNVKVKVNNKETL